MDNQSHPLLSYFPEMFAAKYSPRFQIIITHGILELLVNTLVEVKCKNAKQVLENNRDFPHSVKLVLLNEQGIISDEQFIYLNAFRRLRNKAAHGSQFTLTNDMLIPFKVVLDLNKFQLANTPDGFTMLCNVMVGGFWNKYLDVFFTYFPMPSPTPSPIK